MKWILHIKFPSGGGVDAEGRRGGFKLFAFGK